MCLDTGSAKMANSASCLIRRLGQKICSLLRTSYERSHRCLRLAYWLSMTAAGKMQPLSQVFLRVGVESHRTNKKRSSLQHVTCMLIYVPIQKMWSMVSHLLQSLQSKDSTSRGTSLVLSMFQGAWKIWQVQRLFIVVLTIMSSGNLNESMQRPSVFGSEIQATF